MFISKVGLHSFLAVSLLLCLTAKLIAQDKDKIALLVGVENYENKGFSNLNFAEDDMTALSKVLEAQGFKVTVLLGSADGKSKATRQNVVDEINKRFIPQLKTIGKQGISLVAFAGHGRHKVVKSSEDHFFCPSDAQDADSNTWISINTLITQIEMASSSERNLMLVDACRDNPSRGRGVDGKGFTVSKDAVAVLFASSYNEQAFEPDELKHGLFSYYVLEGLSGAAANFDSEVTWDSLVDYVKGRVVKESERLKSLNKVSGIQHPNSMSNLRGESPVLAKVLKKVPSTLGKEPSDPKTDESGPSAVSFTNTVGMKFIRMKPGKFTMGTLVTGRNTKVTDPAHEVELTKPFYMGVYEVTQKQWNTVMPNKTDPWAAQKNVVIGDDIAANFISWDDCKEFIAKLNELESNIGRKYRLPTEAEWEYACRAGSKTKFSFGNSETELSRYAWWGGMLSKGNAGKDQNAHKVGMREPNKFGLYDIHGNVGEWCEDGFNRTFYNEPAAAKDPINSFPGKTEKLRVIRGGSWRSNDDECCSAKRGQASPDDRKATTGFRVAADAR